MLSFEEFVDYAIDHEKKLWIVFKSVDADGSGMSMNIPLLQQDTLFFNND